MGDGNPAAQLTVTVFQDMSVWQLFHVLQKNSLFVRLPAAGQVDPSLFQRLVQRDSLGWQAELRQLTVLLKAGEATSGTSEPQYSASFLLLLPMQEPSSQEAKTFWEAATSSCFTPMGTFSLFSKPSC